MKILIYRDEGVGTGSFRRLFSVFSKHASRYAIQVINRHFFSTHGWEKSTALIVFPGGRDLPYHFHLQGEKNARIRRYVENGGRFFGVCAGAYYGSAYNEFEKGGELEICGSRELAFFPRKAIGPAYGNGFFRYDGNSGIRAAQITWECGTHAAYYHGGCLFEHAEKYAAIQVMARYSDLPGSPAAVILCIAGKGIALLSGIHPEYSSYDPFLQYLINKILI